MTFLGNRTFGATSISDHTQSDETGLPPRRQTEEALCGRIEEAIRGGDDAAAERVVSEAAEFLTEYRGIASDFLLLAAELGRVGATAALLKAGALIDWADENGGTALMGAAWNGHLEVARLLLDAGADPDDAAEEDGSYGDPRDSGRCALSFALYKGQRDLVDLLEPATSPRMRELAREAAGPWSASDADGPSPPPAAMAALFRAIPTDDPAAVREALAAGADVNGRAYEGTTPLWLAAAGGRSRVLPVLLEHGAEVDAIGDDIGQTPLTVAVRMKRESVLVPLLAAGADPDRPDGAGMTAWQVARIAPGDDSRLESLRRACAEVRGAESPGGAGVDRPGSPRGDVPGTAARD